MPKRSRTVYESDVLRLQAVVEAFPSWRVPRVETMKPKAMKAMCDFLFKDNKHEAPIEADEIRAAITKHISHSPCPICLEPFKAEDRVTRLPCKHTFHTSCAHLASQASLEAEKNSKNTWPRPKCPVCRSAF